MSINAGTIEAVLNLNAEPFARGLSGAVQQLQSFGNSSNESSTRIQALGGAMTTVGSTLTQTVTTPLLGIGVAAVKTSSDFQAQMSKTLDT